MAEVEAIATDACLLNKPPSGRLRMVSKKGMGAEGDFDMEMADCGMSWDPLENDQHKLANMFVLKPRHPKPSRHRHELGNSRDSLSFLATFLAAPVTK
ncbi:unnamed protein product, partial [Prunus brigantina]